jgi:hypothetical protein
MDKYGVVAIVGERVVAASNWIRTLRISGFDLKPGATAGVKHPE